MRPPPAWPQFAEALEAVAAAGAPGDLAAAVGPLTRALGGTLLGVVRIAGPPHALPSHHFTLEPAGFSAACARRPSAIAEALGTLITSIAPIRVRDVVKGAPKPGSYVRTGLLTRFELSDGLCIPRLARDGGRALGVLAGPDLRLDDTATAATCRILIDSVADRIQELLAAPPRRRSLLTERQMACLSEALRGLNSIQIGAKLRLAPKTVDAYLAAAGDRLGAANRTAAVAAAVKLGLIG